MNRADRRAQMRSRFCRGGPPWPPVASDGRPQRAAPTKASLHIEELVLHGFPMETRHAISDATQLELARLLSAQGLPKFVSDASKSDAIDGGSFHVTPQAKANSIGGMIAKAVYGGRRR